MTPDEIKQAVHRLLLKDPSLLETNPIYTVGCIAGDAGITPAQAAEALDALVRVGLVSFDVLPPMVYEHPQAARQPRHKRGAGSKQPRQRAASLRAPRQPRGGEGSTTTHRRR